MARCVSFGTTTVTGEQLLDSSGVAWSGQTFGSYGEAVCALDGEPAHYATCPGQESYWAVFVSRAGGPWQLSGTGISSLTLRGGDAEGFRYVPAVGAPAAPPSPDGVCPAAAASTAPATARTVGGIGTPSAAPAATAAASPSGPATAAATVPTVAAASGHDAPTASAGPSGGSPPAGAASVPPGPGSGLDPGLLAAALAGGALGGLALLRVAAARRRAT